jgi:hypothetical protein
MLVFDTSGTVVMKRIVPPIDPAPNKVPCGPRSTSTRSRSKMAGSGAPASLALVLRVWIGVSSI